MNEDQDDLCIDEVIDHGFYMSRPCPKCGKDLIVRLAFKEDRDKPYVDMYNPSCEHWKEIY